MTRPSRTEWRGRVGPASKSRRAPFLRAVPFPPEHTCEGPETVAAATLVRREPSTRSFALIVATFPTRHRSGRRESGTWVPADRRHPTNITALAAGASAGQSRPQRLRQGQPGVAPWPPNRAGHPLTLQGLRVGTKHDHPAETSRRNPLRTALADNVLARASVLSATYEQAKKVIGRDPRSNGSQHSLPWGVRSLD